MNNKFSFIVLALCLTLSSTSVLAEPETAAPPVYVAFSIGTSFVEEDNVGLDGEDFDDDDFGFKFAVGYRLHKYVAVELSYLDFGETEDDFFVPDAGGDINLESDIKAAAAHAVFILPLSKQFELMAKAGVARWDVEAEASLGAVSASDDEEGTDFAWGVGASYALNQNFALRLEYDRVEIETVDRADLLTIGFKAGF